MAGRVTAGFFVLVFYGVFGCLIPGNDMLINHAKKLSWNQNAWLWIIFVLLAVNVLTMELYPSVWMDEVAYTQPAANAYLGMGFTSTAWSYQLKDAFWAANVPLHPLLLYVWFKVFGFGICQTRLFGYVLWSLAVFFFCLAVRRFGWVTKPKALSLLAVLSFLGQGVIFAYRSARYEPLAVLLVSLCLLAFSIRPALWRHLAILLVCSFFLPACLALGPFCVVMSVLLLLTSRGKLFTELVMVGAGMVAGLAALFLFYNQFGVWDDFLRAVKDARQVYNQQPFPPVQAGFAALLARKGADSLQALVADKSSLILMLAIVLLLAAREKGAGLQHRGLPAFALMVFAVVPISLQLFYSFPIYYWWMRCLPLCLVFTALVETVPLRIGPSKLNWLVIATLFLISVSGLPGRLLLAGLDLRDRDYGRVEDFVRNSVKPRDIVFADFQAFYPLQKLNVTAYYPAYLSQITTPQAASVNLLVIDPLRLPGLKQILGGDWEGTGQEYLCEKRFGVKLLDRFMSNYFKEQTNRKYNLAVYRRTSSAAPTPIKHQ